MDDAQPAAERVVAATTTPHGSLLTGAQARDLRLVEGAQDSGWRSCGYDLAVHTVVDHHGKPVELKDDDTFEIPAHGMVEVIARETLRVPADVVGYAMVKTRLTVNGMFALNIGIVDPHYVGGISTTLINFSKQPFVLTGGEPFLRLTFHVLSTAVQADGRTDEKSRQQYVKERTTKARKHFSETFLDIRTTAKAAAEELLGEWQKRLLVGAPLLVIALTLMTFLFNISQAFGIHRHSVTDVEVHNICNDVARVLQAKSRSPTSLTEEEIDAVCATRGARRGSDANTETRSLTPVRNEEHVSGRPGATTPSAPSVGGANVAPAQSGGH